MQLHNDVRSKLPSNLRDRSPDKTPVAWCGVLSSIRVGQASLGPILLKAIRYGRGLKLAFLSFNGHERASIKALQTRIAKIQVGWVEALVHGGETNLLQEVHKRRPGEPEACIVINRSQSTFFFHILRVGCAVFEIEMPVICFPVV